MAAFFALSNLKPKPPRLWIFKLLNYKTNDSVLPVVPDQHHIRIRVPPHHRQLLPIK